MSEYDYPPNNKPFPDPMEWNPDPITAVPPNLNPIPTPYESVQTTPKALDRQAGGAHYKDFAIQPVEFCQKNELNMIESNVIKYVCRHRLKGKRQDIEKAIHMLECLLEIEYE